MTAPTLVTTMLTVQATSLSPTVICYICPHCRDAKHRRMTHRHGNDGNMADRDTETRTAHCIDSPSVRGFIEVRIIINDETSRKTP